MGLFNIIFENVMYILAIALQLAAAILLVGNTDIRPEKIIKAYCQKHKAIAIQNDGSLLDRSGLEETVNSAWTNRIAFSYLVAGYLIGVLGNCTIDRWIALLIVGVLAAVIFLVTFIIARRKAKTFPNIGIDDLPREKGVTIMKHFDSELVNKQ